MQKGKSIYDTPVQSAILIPRNGTTLDSQDGMVKVCGYAYSGGGRGIQRVDVSGDGVNWIEATREKPFVDDGENWDWTLWNANLELAPGNKNIMCRAVDSSGNSQPSSQLDIYNVRGVMVNGIDMINIQIK